MMPHLLPASSWALSAPSPSWLHGSWNLCDVSASFPWLLLSQTHTSIGRSSPSLGFVWLLINSAYTAHNIVEISVRLTLRTAKIILSVPEESQITFLHLLWKFHLTLLPLLFPQTIHFSPPTSHQAFLMTSYKIRQRTIPSAPLLTAVLISAQESKRQSWSLGLNLEPRQALCSLWKGSIWPGTRHQNYWKQWN